MTEDEINKQVSKETGSMSSVSVGIELDREALRGLRDSVKAINKEAKEMAINFKEALGALKEMKNDYGLTQVNRSTAISPGGTGGAAPQQGAAGTQIVGGRAYAAQPIAPAPNAVTAALNGREVLAGSFAAGVSSAEKYEGVAGKNAGGTGLRGLMQQGISGGFNSAGNFASMAGTLAKVGVQAIDERVERGRGYALAADKSTLQMQQITGMSQREVMNNLRMPLTDYKLGTNGINQLMSLQARTGINAGQQASSIEAMRTISGFSMGAEGATSIIESLADPETVNKMFMMTGMSMIGPGGKQRSAQSVIQGLAKRAGLDNKQMAESAIAPGSVTRSTLSAMGVAGDLQDQVIQYAQSNVAFREKGGKGSYDPTKAADRKRMGIDDTFAMQAEETERKRGKRDEQFYRDQAGAYAKLERQTQSLTDAMGKLEHVIAPIIGARTSSRIAQKIIGGVASVGMGFALGGPGGALLGAAGALGSILGDPRPIGDERDDELFGPIGGTTIPPTTISSTIPSSTIPSSTVPSTTIPSSTIPPSIGGTPPLSNAELDSINNRILRPYGGAKTAAANNEYKMLDTFSPMYNSAFNTGRSANTGVSGVLSTKIDQLIYSAASEGIKIGVTSGQRSDQDQEKLFFDRFSQVSDSQKTYRDVDPVTGFSGNYPTVKYMGKTWAKKPGVPYVAPPGKSLHQLGLAADLDLSSPGAQAWLSRNLTRFGLTTGDNEPWHVQLAWTKGMSVEQFLGKTAVTFDPSKPIDLKSPGVNWESTIQPGSGVNLNSFSQKLLKQLGTNITLDKLMMLRSWAQKEGSGGLYNPFNVISGSGRKYKNSKGELVDRSETNFNYAAGEYHEAGSAGTNVQDFDNEDQGVAYTLSHLLRNESGFINFLRQEKPTYQQFIDFTKNTAAKAKGWSAAPAVLKSIYVAPTELAAARKTNDYSGLYRSYGSYGIGNANPYMVGDPNPEGPISIPSAPMLSSGSSGTGSTYHEGSTITISPVIHMNGTGGNNTVSEYDLKLMAKKIARLIEQEANINKFRSM